MPFDMVAKEIGGDVTVRDAVPPRATVVLDVDVLGCQRTTGRRPDCARPAAAALLDTGDLLYLGPAGPDWYRSLTTPSWPLWVSCAPSY